MKIYVKILLFIGLHLFTVDTHSQYQRIYNVREAGQSLHYRDNNRPDKDIPEYFELWGDSLTHTAVGENGLFLFGRNGWTVYSALYKDMKWRSTRTGESLGTLSCGLNPHWFLEVDTLLINGRTVVNDYGRNIIKVENIPQVLIKAKNNSIYGYSISETQDSITKNILNKIVFFKKEISLLKWSKLDSITLPYTYPINYSNTIKGYIYNDSCRYIFYFDNIDNSIVQFTSNNGKTWDKKYLKLDYGYGSQILQVNDTLIFSNRYKTLIGSNSWRELSNVIERCSNLVHSGKHWWIFNRWGFLNGYFDSINSPKIVQAKNLPELSSITWENNTGIGYGIDLSGESVYKISNWGMP